MADNENLVLNSVLCFISTKAHHIAPKILRQLLNDFYSADELSLAKKIYLEHIDTLNINELPKISRKRRDSINRSAHEIDDILSLFQHLDENKQISNLPKFVAASPDNMPSLRLTDGDLSIVLTKLSNLEELVTNLANLLPLGNNLTQANNDILMKIQSDINNYAGTAMSNRVGRNLLLNHDDHSLLTTSVGTHYTSTENTPSTSAAPFIPDSRNISNEGAQLEGDWPNIPGSIISNGLHSVHSWGSSSAPPGEHDFEAEGGDFTKVISKSTRRLEKRARSPGNNNIESAKRPNEGRSPNNIIFSGSIPNRPNPPSRPPISQGIMGRSTTCHALKAAESSKSEIAIFCVSNIATNYTVNDIRKHCLQLGARVRYCFDISNEQYKGKSFKVAVGRDVVQLINNELAWPARVIIKPWRSSNVTTQQLNSVTNSSSSSSVIPQSTTTLIIDNEVASINSTNIISYPNQQSIHASNNSNIENSSMCDKGYDSAATSSNLQLTAPTVVQRSTVTTALQNMIQGTRRQLTGKKRSESCGELNKTRAMDSNDTVSAVSNPDNCEDHVNLNYSNLANEIIAEVRNGLTWKA